MLLNETWTTKCNERIELRNSTHAVVAVSADRNKDYAFTENRGNRGHGGVAILARKALKIASVGPADDVRLVSVVVKGPRQDILVIAAYLPTGTSRDKCIEYQETIDRICTIIQEHGNGRFVLLGGDFNVDLRKDANSNKKFVLTMMKDYDLVVPQGIMEGGCSFYISETTAVSQLDYFLVGREHMHMIRGCNVIGRSALNRSDHEPVFIRIAVTVNACAMSTHGLRIDWAKARRQGRIEEYQNRIREGISRGMTIEDIVKSILDAATILPKKGKLNWASQWWTPELTQLRQACLMARATWKKAEGEEKEVAEKLFRQEKRRYLNKQKRMKLDKQAEGDKELEEQCRQLNPLYYQFMRHTQTGRSISRLKVQGQELFEPMEIAQAFLRHFERVGQPLNHNSFETYWKIAIDGVVESMCEQYEKNILRLDEVKEITEVEVTEALKALKRNKAPGSDGVTPEHLIEADGAASRGIAKCLQDILSTTRIPDNFKCGLITPVFKGHGGDPASTDSYRDISVLSTLCKVFEKILVERLNAELLSIGIPSELQFAYCKNRSTLQANFILQETISANRDLGRAVYVAFLDVRKCFNSVWHNGLLYKLICANVSPRVVLMLRSMYREFNVRVKIRGRLSDDGKILQGLKQGGVLSTSLLTLYMDDKIKMIQRASIGAMVGRMRVGIIAYADDEVLISSDPVEMQRLLDIAYHHSCLWRYKYNVTKCKVLVYGKRHYAGTWRLGDENVVGATEYTHLGIIMAPRGAPRRRVEEAMNKARRAMYSKCPYGLNISRMSPLTLHATWRVYAEPALTYSLAVTRLVDADMTYLEGMLLRVYRLMQGLPARVQKAATYAMLGALPCRIMVMKVTLQFLGFLFRAANEHALTKYVLLHGAENAERETSLARGWEKMLEELELPTLTDAVYRYKKCGQAEWNKMTRAAIQRRTEDEYRRIAREKESLWWLDRLVIAGRTDEPPEKFWPSTRYSAMGRLSTATRIKLLVGHSWVASGVARRHSARTSRCPLCREREETLEHFLYECTKLQEERKEAEARTGVKLQRAQEAVKTLLEAGPWESMLIHQVYKARVRKETEMSPDTAERV